MSWHSPYKRGVKRKSGNNSVSKIKTAPSITQLQKSVKGILLIFLKKNLVSYPDLQTGSVNHSLIVHKWSASPAAIAGLQGPRKPSGRRNVRTAQQKL